MKRYFGCHVSVAGGLANGIAEGVRLGVNTIQIHPSPPQRWNSKPFASCVEVPFLTAQRKSGVEKVFFHGIYLINLANPDKQKFHLSKLSLVHYLELSARIKGEGVIFHVGSNKDHDCEETGFKQAACGVDWVLDNAPNQARLLLEVAAGSGKIIGDKLEELAYIYELVKDQDRVGFALDTQHMWASGYDLKGQAEEVIAEVDRVFGLSKVWAIHLNDSMTELASKKDRHENLGAGRLGEKALGTLVQHPRLKEIPFILETPGLKDTETAANEVEKLKALIELNYLTEAVK